ncbi:MAG: hypothetical protein KAT66_06940 [Candidatus Lokiarchaeota archaeon]|nr:hypothetical protein [Candidatus Lokiarchaeota archaeon]
MASPFTWIKKELGYIKDSFLEIIKGFILFILAFSGLGFALVLRYLGYNGTIISFLGVATELIALILCYFMFKGYVKPREEPEPSKPKGKKL